MPLLSTETSAGPSGAPFGGKVVATVRTASKLAR
jgi:hypothetical protein